MCMERGKGRTWLFDFLQALGTRFPPPLLLAFLALYLLVFNDLRYNRQAWRHGVLGMLAARELDAPCPEAAAAAPPAWSPCPVCC